MAGENVDFSLDSQAILSVEDSFRNAAREEEENQFAKNDYRMMMSSFS